MIYTSFNLFMFYDIIIVVINLLEYNYRSITIKDKILDVVSTLLVNMIVIIMATKIFKNISVDNIFYTFV